MAGPADAAPIPQSAGASASLDGSDPALIAARTRGQVQTDFNGQVMQTAEDRAGPDGQDHTVYVPGTKRTLAARDFSVENAVAEKTAMATDPEFAGAVKAIKDDSAGVTTDAFKNLAGDNRAIELAHEARDAATPDAIDLFKDQDPVNAQPVVDKIDEILAGPSGKRSAVVSVLKDVRAKLFDANGDLETMPDQLYGARQNITDKLKAGGTDPAAMLSKSELNAVKTVLDPVITNGAPAFGDYLKNYADLSKPIDQMTFLQSKLLGPGKITDASGQVTWGGMQKLLEKIAVDRGKSGFNAAKTLTDDQLQNLIAIRNELAANHYRDRLAAVKGSDTAQQLSMGARMVAGDIPAPVNAAVHLGLVGTHGLGNVAYEFGLKPWLKNRAARLAAASDAELKSQLLNTTPSVDAAGNAVSAATARAPEPPQAAPIPAAVAAEMAKPVAGPANSPYVAGPPPAAAAAPSPPPGPRTPPGGAPAVGVTPIASALSTPNGTVVPGRYVIREMRDVIASQRRDGADNPAYDQTLQPRDRSRKASVAQVADMAANPRFPEMGFSHSTATGAPVIGRARSLLPGEEPAPDNPAMVESGNARDMMRKQIYANGGPNAAMLRATTEEHARALGQDISGMNRPGLYFERSNQLDPAARARLADDMGAQPVADMSATERAAGDARRIPNGTLAMIQDGDVTLAKNALFARAFAEHVVPPAERANFMTADGYAARSMARHGSATRSLRLLTKATIWCHRWRTTRTRT